MMTDGDLDRWGSYPVQRTAGLLLTEPLPPLLYLGLCLHHSLSRQPPTFLSPPPASELKGWFIVARLRGSLNTRVSRRTISAALVEEFCTLEQSMPSAAGFTVISTAKLAQWFENKQSSGLYQQNGSCHAIFHMSKYQIKIGVSVDISTQVIPHWH